MLKKIKQVKALLIEERVYLILCVLLVFLCFGIYIFPHYSTDTYGMMVEADELSAVEYIKSAVARNLKNARYSLGMTKAIIKLLGFNPQGAGVITNFSCMILLIINVIYAYSEIKKYFSSQYRGIVFGAVAGIFMSPCYSDWFQFPEAAPYYFWGILLCHIGVSMLYKNKIIHGVLLLMIAVGYYQIIFSFYVFYYMLTLTLELTNKIGDKKLLKYYCKGVLKGVTIYIFLVGSNFLWIKIAGSTRVHMDIIENVKTVLQAQKGLWMMASIGKKTYIYIFICLCIMILYIIETFIYSRKNKQYALFFGMTSLSITGIYISIFTSHIFAEAWLSQRTVVIFYTIPFLVLIIAIKLLSMNYIKHIKGFFVIVIVLLCAAYIYKTNALAIDLIKTNASDKLITQLIDSKIQEYEKEQNITIENVAFIEDCSKIYAYPGIYSAYDLNVRAWAISWARKPMLDFYTGRDLNSIKCPEDVYESIYKDKNWDCYSEEQIYFKGNTVYIGIY